MKTPTTTPSIARRNTIKTAVRNLTVLGCQFKIIDPTEGNEYGDLLVAPPKARTKSNHFTQYGYQKKVEAMEVGASELFETPEGVDPARYRGVIAGHACKHFGNGSCTSHVEGDIIEILRLA